MAISPNRYARLPLPGDCKLSLSPLDHDGWLIMNGRKLKKADFPVLFQRLAITADTMTLPDSRDLLIASAGTLKPGELGGASNVTLKAENLPAHHHGYTDVMEDFTAGKAGLVAGILPILTGATAKTTPKNTDDSGSGAAVRLPKPPHLALSLFMFGG